MEITRQGEYPAAVRVAREIGERIRRGEYPAESWLPTERTFADEFGVDRSIIRSALVDLEQNQLIIREPGRRPRVARGTGRMAKRPPDRAASLQTIAAILPYHPIYPSGNVAILKGIHAALRAVEGAPRLQVVDTFDIRGNVAADIERQALIASREEGDSGVILWPAQAEKNRDEVQHLRDSGRPVIYVDRYPEEEGFDYVGVDNRLAARTAVEYLLRLGHTRIAHLTNTDPVRPVFERAEGYRLALERAGITPDPALTVSVQAVVNLDVSPAVRHLRELSDPPTAVFAMNDTLAHGFLVEAQKIDWRCPEDISVIGFDDMERFSPRPGLLTTMHQPFEEIGQMAAELLLHRIAEERNGPARAAARHMLLPVPLIERSTCRKRD